ncbi:MAG TPA: IS4 family transposase [Tepidisphaeraceae bacterium]|jgi:hypothetical protein|nr:IS4 family transposase [Tepidisphaeraceae bacterium]
MGAEPKKPLEQDDLVCLKLVRAITPFLNNLEVEQAAHGNAELTITDTLVVLLCAFFNPTVRSLRLVEQLSQMPWAKEQLEIERVCRSTLSDALARFNPEALVPVINGLLQQMPCLRRSDPDLAAICQRVIAGDGSNFNLAADVAWALMRSRGGKNPTMLGYCRLNLQLDIDHFTPAELSVSGNDEGSEAAAFQKKILPGVIYLFDRNFVHFGLINTVIDRGSDFVLRLKKDTGFQSSAENILCPRDRELGVISDRVGILPGSPGGRTGAPPTCTLREVVVMGDDGAPVRLLTTLLDVPAYVISALYRRRWQIELFLRWLKVWAGFEHLMSHSQRGVTFNFYVAVIGCLLMHVRTGRKVNKYALFLFGQVAAGLATLEQILPMLERIEREKELERQRLAKKRKEKQLSGKIPAQLPG